VADNAVKFLNGERHQRRPDRSGRIAVAYVTDRNYHDMTLFALASVALGHRTPVDFFVFQHGYLAEVPSRYRSSIEARGHSLTVAEAPSYAPADTISIGRHLTTTTYLRVTTIERLAREYAYVLYLDGDTLAFGDLQCDKLAGFPKTAAACLDLSISTGFDDPAFAQNCRRNGVSAEFFNAGVVMINGTRWLQTAALERFTDQLHRHTEFCPYFTSCAPNDQCAMNLTLGDDFNILPVTYNVQKSAFNTRSWSTALIRHYTGRAKFMPVRPWRCDRREHSLLRHISAETNLPFPHGSFDYGLSYSLNALRRYRTARRYERAIVKIENRIPKLGAREAPMPEKSTRGHTCH
jgi:lipopolysaccharide biosynthesis glycosyltransferase